MTRFILAFLLLLFSLHPMLQGAELPSAEATEVGFDPQRVSRILEVGREYVESGKLSGTVTLAARHGKIFLKTVSGYQSLENDTPMTEDTIFRIYSMTKPITTVAAMLLYEEGRFGLTEPLSKYLPEFEDVKVLSGEENDAARLVSPKRPIQIRDLMTQNHLSEEILEMSPLNGFAFGLGFAVLQDVPVTGVAGTVGEYNWGGYASTLFWSDPQEDLFVIFLTQLIPSSTYPLRSDLKAAVYQALID